MMKMRSVLLASTIAALVLLVVGQSSCCRAKPARVTVEEVEELIKEEIPIGSTKSQVIAFLDSLKIDSLKVVRDEYREGTEGLQSSLDPKAKSLIGRTKGHLGAAILDVERICRPSYGAIYRIDMMFYFGEGEVMIDHTVTKLGSVM